MTAGRRRPHAGSDRHEFAGAHVEVRLWILDQPLLAGARLMDVITVW